MILRREKARQQRHITEPRTALGKHHYTRKTVRSSHATQPYRYGVQMLLKSDIVKHARFTVSQRIKVVRRVQWHNASRYSHV